MKNTQYLKWTNNQNPENKDIPYIMAAIRERVMFDWFSQNRSDFTLNSYSYVESKASWDVYITSGGTNYLCEVKIREFNSTTFGDEGWILEEFKYNNLIKYINTPKAKQKNAKAFYINIFRDGVVVWEVKKENNYKFKKQWYQNSTVAGTGYREKSVVLLPTSTGTFYPHFYNLFDANRDAQAIFKFLYPTTIIAENYLFKKANENTKENGKT